MRMLTAQYVLPVSTEPIANGAVLVEDSIIKAVGSLSQLASDHPDVPVEDLGEAAIVPGFVNCHSHLEITGLRGSLDDVEHDFRSWLLKLTRLRAELSDEAIEEFAIAGALEGAAAGVTCFGDIGRSGSAGVRAVKKAGLRGIVFQETEFSPDNRTADDDFVKLGTRFEKLAEEASDLVRVGISPHSPYTVSSRLFELISQYSLLNSVPISIHAAESVEEHNLLANGVGFFTDIYEKFNFEWQSPGCSPIQYLERLGVLLVRPLLVHCVTVSPSDIQRIQNNGAKIAHCPKSNAKFGHGYAPFEDFLDQGIAVGLGTDSVASNNVCDLIEESRFAALAARNRAGTNRFLSAEEVLRAATLGGAEAMGLDGSIGSLEPGKQADIAVISLGQAAQKPIANVNSAIVFCSNARDVVLTIVAGKEVYRLPN